MPPSVGKRAEYCQWIIFKYRKDFDCPSENLYLVITPENWSDSPVVLCIKQFCILLAIFWKKVHILYFVALIQTGWYICKCVTDILFVICPVRKVKQRRSVWTSSSYFWMRSREIHDWMKYYIHCMMRRGLQKSSVLMNRMSKLALNVSSHVTWCTEMN